MQELLIQAQLVAHVIIGPAVSAVPGVARLVIQIGFGLGIGLGLGLGLGLDSLP